jgi:5-methylcytosine-specific restriction enzyme B
MAGVRQCSGWPRRSTLIASAPSVTGFALVDGPLRRVASQGAADGDSTYVPIIAELNRGNIAEVSDSGPSSLEYRDEHVTLQYIPRNLWLIETSSTADHSIALM